MAFIWIFFIFLSQNALRFVIPESAATCLLIITVIFYALAEGPGFGFGIGIFSGVFFEIFSTGKFGFSIPLLGALGWVSGLSAKTVFGDSLFSEILLPLVGTYLSALLTLMSARWTAGEPVAFWIIFEVFSWSQLLWTAFLSPLVFFFLRKVSLAREEKRVWIK